MSSREQSSRSLTRSMTGLPRVTLRKRLGRAIRGGQPWIYRDALAASPRIADGAVVLVAGGDGRPIARGFWDATSPIAVRVLGGEGDLDVAAEINRRVTEALARRLRAIDRAQTDAFRWIHGEADALPGVHVDVYGRALNIRYDGGGARAFYRDLPPRLREVAGKNGLAVEAIFERRPRQGGKSGQEGQGGKAPKDGQGPENETERTLPLYGALPDGEIEIRENGLLFGADLRRGQKGGLFLDQRENRALVRTLAPGRRVLNLFGYTGGFSIYAAAGGARETTTVDVAAPAIAAARRNFERNRLPAAAARFAAEDAFAFLTRAAAAGERFDLVISDPPSFAPSRRALETGLHAYQRLHRLCAAVTAPGGLFCAASCSSHVDRAAFVATVRDGARDAGRRAQIREIYGAAVDHPVLPQFPEGDYLKFAVVVL
jgi:23S rRNA (cytosine1962-C5)-methyltransferase